MMQATDRSTFPLVQGKLGVDGSNTLTVNEQASRWSRTLETPQRTNHQAEVGPLPGVHEAPEARHDESERSRAESVLDRREGEFEALDARLDDCRELRDTARFPQGHTASPVTRVRTRKGDGRLSSAKIGGRKLTPPILGALDLHEIIAAQAVRNKRERASALKGCQPRLTSPGVKNQAERPDTESI